MASFGYFATLLDVFLRFSRIHDLLIPPQVRVAAVIAAAGIVALLLTGRIFAPLTSKVGQYVLFCTFWMMLSIGVSVWPGGAYSYFVEHWVKSIVTFFFVVAFVRTFRRLRTTVLTVGAGCALVGIAAFLGGADMAGRSTVGLSYGNPNDLAFLLLFGAPFACWAVFDKRARPWRRIAFLGGLAIGLPVLAKTGSRAGLLCLMVVTLYVFWRISTTNRLRLLAVGALLAPAALFVVPQELIVRYSTLFTAQAKADPLEGDAAELDQAASYSAAESANARLELLKRSITVTLNNPVLGVGPGMFVVAENELAVAEGRRRGFWKSSHNMYTQVSSELGIVGFILFVLILRWSWKAFDRAEKCDPRLLSFSRELRTLGLALKCALLIYLVAGLTLGIAYGPFMPVLAGLAVSISQLIGGAEEQRRRGAARDSERAAEAEVELETAGEIETAAHARAGQAVAS